MTESSEHWPGRFKCEEILAVGCPKCGALPHKWCDRAGDKLSKQGLALLKAGTPPSHQERMWMRQGHSEHEMPALLARQKPGLWDEAAGRPGQPAGRPAPRGGCTPCATERKIREGLRSPLFPVDFPCRHHGPSPVPQYPVRYTADRPCPECDLPLPAEVAVQSPAVVGYRCGQGHKWLAKEPGR